MRTLLLLLISAVAAASSSRRCVNDVDWVQCTCVDDYNSELIKILSSLEDGVWESTVHATNQNCDDSKARQWLSLITGGGRTSGAVTGLLPPPPIAGEGEEKRDCERAKQDCSQLHCPYGVQRFIDASDCEVCLCHDPCKDHVCPDSMRCAVDLYLNEETGDTEFRAICRDVYKIGSCPKLVNATENCIQECQSDSDCPGTFKCCYSGCGSSCLAPLPADEDHTTTVKPIPGSLWDEAPSIDPSDEQIKEEEGSFATMRCVARGRPTPTVVWRKDSIIVNIKN